MAASGSGRRELVRWREELEALPVALPVFDDISCAIDRITARNKEANNLDFYSPTDTFFYIFNKKLFYLLSVSVSV
jgi:hypothetical protein